LGALVVVIAACGTLSNVNSTLPTSPNATTPTTKAAAGLTSKPGGSVPSVVRPAKCAKTWTYGSAVGSPDHQSERPGVSKELVPPSPAYLTTCRYAGLNQKVKDGALEKSRVTSGSDLNSFVRYLDQSSWQVVNPCPMSTGQVDLLQFAYPTGPDVIVSVDADGCEFVSNGSFTVWGGSIVQRLKAWVGSDSN
jgi:hypothetical protein